MIAFIYMMFLSFVKKEKRYGKTFFLIRKLLQKKKKKNYEELFNRTSIFYKFNNQ